MPKYRIYHQQSAKYVKPRPDTGKGSTVGAQCLIFTAEVDSNDSETHFELIKGEWGPIMHVESRLYVIKDHNDTLMLSDNVSDSGTDFKYSERNQRIKCRNKAFWYGNNPAACTPVIVRTSEDRDAVTFILQEVSE